MPIKRLLGGFSSLLLCVLITQFSFAQNKTITGKVLDDKGSPVQGATVTIKGSRTGTATDAAGAFKLSVSANAKTLVISSVGFTAQEIDVSSQTTVTASLVPSNASLNEVVVTGYGTARKKDVTGAISSISAKDFSVGVTSPLESIEGKVPGLAITSPGGDPNGNLIIRLRGQASLSGGQTPLIVLDGVPLDDPTQLANIPPNDIASFDVLKDASAAAIYGTRAANGVIIVNTKKGHAGKTTVEYNTFVGMDVQAKYYPLLNLAQWKSASINHLVNDLGDSLSTAQNVVASYDQGGNTDWQKAITRTAVTQSHNIAISGGSGGFNYRGSVTYLDQQGSVINSGKSGIGLRFNAEQKALNDKLDITMGIVNTSYNRDYTDYNQFTYVFFNPPSYPVYKNGTYYAFSDFSEANPVQHLNEEVNQGKEYLTQLQGTANYSIIPSLKVGVTGSTSHFNKQTNYFAPAFPVEGTFTQANAYDYNTDSKKGDFHVNYNNQWGKNNLGVTAVYEYNYFSDYWFGTAGQQYLVPQLQGNYLAGGNSTLNQPQSYRDEFFLISYLGRAAYNYDNRFYATASFRRDGSSKLGANNRWGNFPSFDVAWALSKEEFMKDVTWVNYLKLRAGYGVTGNQDAITPYNTQFLLAAGTNSYFDPSNSANQYPKPYAPSQNANPYLKWEQRAGKNVGVDFSLFNNIITGDLDYFNDKTSNLLYNYTVPTPPFYINTILANVGSLTNKGLELGLTAKVVSKEHFTWTLGGQISFIKTKVTNLSGTYAGGYKLSTDNIAGGVAEGRGLSSNPITYLKVGYSPYTFYLPHYEGVDKNGNQLFDSAGVAKVPYSNATNYYIDPAPKFNYSVTSTFTYNNWSLSIYARGVYGQKIFNNTALDYANITRLPGNNVFKAALTNGIRDNATASDLYLEKASYLRLDNATLGYSFNKIKGIQSLRVYVTGRNLFVITKYDGLDPEIRPADSNQAYIDATYGGDAYYPRTRSFLVGLNLSFQ
jgi:TonB-dependent starch-binding outer membrane protein SusC